MSVSSEVSVSWAQALAWRMERQLLEPVGSDSVAGVVRRLGAVLSMDESLAELAVRTRRKHRARRARESPGSGQVIKAFAFRGSMHYLAPEDGGIYLALRCAGRQWELPSWVEYYRLTPVGLARLPCSGARCAQRRTVDRRRAWRGADEAARIPASEAGLRRGRGHADQAADLAGRHEFRSAARRAAHVPAPRHATLAGAASPTVDDAGPRAIVAYLRTYGPATLDHIHYWLGSGLSAGRNRLDRWFAGLGEPAGRGRRRRHPGVCRARGPRRP